LRGKVDSAMKVFISHANEDMAIARRIADGLKKMGLEAWLAESEILPGENFAAMISDALDDSQAMVVIITPNALRSPWVRQEIEYALGKQSYSGRVVPVVAGPAGEMPSDRIPWILRRLQMIVLPDAEPQDEGIRQIAAALRKAS